MSMSNNDILIRLRYALDIKDIDMVEIFKLGGIELTKEEVLEMLTKSKNSYHNEADNDDDIVENDYVIKCNNIMLESFLNGFITFKRGKQDPKPGQPDRQAMSLKNKGSVNNLILKKLKIALALTSEDMLDILEDVGVMVTKGELSALLRKEGHKNYKECGDRYARNFLKGLTVKYRG
ncbi:DUF1456 family protein [Bacillus sp. DX1.1]|uniref:DUF1456 family protein n=1 Tax=unclassified Bacillus (in: firmicutes) TaxID=185979 RepID=UPI00257092DF|nr:MULTISPECIES: DUF1456 family protein [unclassified Bacillus (in: firmicutes)]MDM5153169.1 DUF1456 family protein [Bacillus sp. DX1.1]MDM5186846.1 DUF1456 family protein [Bacillus sp. DX4.1]WJE82137.1 DUF1456 family protein [Bacillus sp. DX3.1]